MRKMLAMIMTAVILFISGVPMSVAKDCAKPAHDGHSHGIHEKHSAEMLHQHVHPPLTRGEISIDRCCNFHGAIDTLPHMLAPCLVDSSLPEQAEASVLQVSSYTETAWPIPKARVPLPPPQYL